MEILDKRYIDEAVRIRRDYLTCVYDITQKEETVMKYKIDLENSINNMDDVVKTMTESKNISNKILNEKLIDLELNINKIQNELIPINKKIKQLEIDAKKLNTIIKEKYTTLSEMDVRRILEPYLLKMESNLRF